MVVMVFRDDVFGVTHVFHVGVESGKEKVITFKSRNNPDKQLSNSKPN